MRAEVCVTAVNRRRSLLLFLCERDADTAPFVVVSFRPSLDVCPPPAPSPGRLRVCQPTSATQLAYIPGVAKSSSDEAACKLPYSVYFIYLLCVLGLVIKDRVGVMVTIYG